MKILFIPTSSGGWNLDPETATFFLDDLAVACDLEAQGHDVWFCEYYQRKFQKIKWRKTFPRSFEPGVSDGFDAVYVHTKLPHLVEHLANPVRNTDKNAEYFKLVLTELNRFNGPIYCVTTDDRDVYYKKWAGDLALVEKCLGRESYIYDKELTKSFPSLLQRVEISFISDQQLKWSAKWCVENLIGQTFPKGYDFVIDGYNKWKDYAPERRKVISDLIQAHPNSATLGNLTIKPLPNLSNEKLVRGVTKTVEATGCAMYKFLSWEPFHFKHSTFWTTRTNLAMASDSLAFTTMEGAPECIPTYALGELPEVTPELIEKQHEAIKAFAAQTPWPEAYIV